MPDAVLRALDPVLSALQRQPSWTAWALVGFALLLVFLGRHGQRPLMGAVLAASLGAAAAAFLGTPAPGAAMPRLPALAAGAFGLAVGFALPGQAGALACGIGGGLLGRWLATSLGVPWPLFLGAAPMAGLFFAVGFVNQRHLAVVMPPVAAAIAGALASARILGVYDAGMLLAAVALLCAIFIPLAIERDARARRRAAAQADAALKERVKAAQEEKKARMAAHLSGGKR